MKKIICSLGIVSVVVGSSMSFAFSDVKDNHWAIKQINSMTEKKIISGYDDGTFKPSKDITKIESLILFAKVAGIEKYPDAAKEYEEKYKEELSAYNTKYKNFVSYLRGIGMLSKEDVSGLLGNDQANTPITREEMAKLITKALGKDEEVSKKSFFILDFSDASKITPSAKGYVEYVYNEGIMTGMNNNEFSPKTYVIRAQAAVIFDKIYDKVNFIPNTSSTTTPKPSTPDSTVITLSLTEGELTTVDTILKTIEIDDDIFEYDESTKFYINGTKVDEYDIFEGMEVVEAIIKTGKITSLNVDDGKREIDEMTGKITGEIVSIKIASDKIITIESSNKEKSYYLSTDTEYLIDGEEADVLDYEVGDEVTLTVDEGYVEKMVKGDIEETSAYKIGTITYINEENEKIKIKLNDGTTQTIYLAGTYKVIDSKKATTKKLSSLKKGDDIIVVGKYDDTKYKASVIVLYYE